jgi:hypothetical protein
MDPLVTQVLKPATTHLLYRLGGVHNSVVRQDTLSCTDVHPLSILDFPYMFVFLLGFCKQHMVGK